MTTLFKWRIRCNTDDKFEFIWSEEMPTSCPINKNHNINNSLTCIIDKIEPNIVKIKEDSIVTGGNFRCETKIINSDINTTSITNFSYKYPISVYAVYFVSTIDHEGDIIETNIAPDIPVGLITKNVNTNDTILDVSQTVIDNIMIGYDVKITNQINTDDLGKVIAIDKIKKQITTENFTSHNFTVNSSVILLTVKIVENYEIGPPTQHVIGDSKIGGMYVPADTIIQVKYQNKSLDKIKKLVFKIEYMY